jgi:hypothetical protein
MDAVEAELLRLFAVEVTPLGFTVLPDVDRGQEFGRSTGELEHVCRLYIDAHPTHIFVIPTLGIHHAQTARLLCLFLGVDQSAVSSIGQSLDGLMRQRDLHVPVWRSVGGADEVEPTVRRLVHDLREYGLPEFFDGFRTLEDLAAALAERRSTNGRMHLAIVEALLGRRSESRAALEAVRQSIDGAPAPIAEQTRRFVDSFERHFGTAEASP